MWKLHVFVYSYVKKNQYYSFFKLKIWNEFLIKEMSTLTSLPFDLSPMLDDDDCKHEVVYLFMTLSIIFV